MSSLESTTDTQQLSAPPPAPTPQTVNLDSLTPVQSLNVLWSMLNNASSKGAFTIDESYVLKIIFQKITAVVAPESLSPPTTDDNKEKDIDV